MKFLAALTASALLALGAAAQPPTPKVGPAPAPEHPAPPKEVVGPTVIPVPATPVTVTPAPAGYPSDCPTCLPFGGSRWGTQGFTARPTVVGTRPSDPTVSWTDPTGSTWTGSAEAIAVVKARFGSAPAPTPAPAPRVVPAPGGPSAGPKSDGFVPMKTAAPGPVLDNGAVEALDIVNGYRAANGLPPYARDDGLTAAAAAAAKHRAERRMDGHTANDFGFLPAGCRADAAGCAAWRDGFGACCVFDPNYRTAGAAFYVGADGLRYCHLFLRR